MGALVMNSVKERRLNLGHERRFLLQGDEFWLDSPAHDFLGFFKTVGLALERNPRCHVSFQGLFSTRGWGL